MVDTAPDPATTRRSSLEHRNAFPRAYRIASHRRCLSCAWIIVVVVSSPLKESPRSELAMADVLLTGPDHNFRGDRVQHRYRCHRHRNSPGVPYYRYR